MNILIASKTIEQDPMDELLVHSSRTIDSSLHSQIKDKYRTFTHFNYREAYRNRKQSRKKKEEGRQTEHTLAEALATFMLGTLDSKEESKKKKQVPVAEELAGVKSERR